MSRKEREREREEFTGEEEEEDTARKIAPPVTVSHVLFVMFAHLQTLVVSHCNFPILKSLSTLLKP